MQQGSRSSQTPRLLDGKVAVVTGAGGGVGAGIARQFSVAGASVVAHYYSSAHEAEALVEEINRTGGRAIALQADVTDPSACDQLMAATVAEFGTLDALVNNAGVRSYQSLADMTVDQWREVVDTNVTGTFLATQAATNIMRANGGGSIIQIASIEGSQPGQNHAHYCASKAAIIMFARAAALEFGPLGIRVNTVSPGLIDRDGLADAWPDGVGRWQANAPLGRLGSSTNIGDACVFLASSMASWVTGHDLVVDGGMSANPSW